MWSERAEVRAKSGWETGLQGLVTELVTGSEGGRAPLRTDSQDAREQETIAKSPQSPLPAPLLSLLQLQQQLLANGKPEGVDSSNPPTIPLPRAGKNPNRWGPVHSYPDPTQDSRTQAPLLS